MAHLGPSAEDTKAAYVQATKDLEAAVSKIGSISLTQSSNDKVYLCCSSLNDNVDPSAALSEAVPDALSSCGHTQLLVEFSVKGSCPC